MVVSGHSMFDWHPFGSERIYYSFGAHVMSVQYQLPRVIDVSFFIVTLLIFRNNLNQTIHANQHDPNVTQT